MATYREIHGRSIKSVTTDPSSPSAITEGEIWYNTTSGTFKSRVLVEAWSSGEDVPGTANRLGFASGTVTAGLYASGYEGTGTAPPANLMTDASFEYDGTNWTSGGAVGTRAFIGGSCGTQTASLKMGGNSPLGATRGETEEYNGSSWAEQEDMPTGNQGNTGAGIQTAALSISGTADYDITLEYDGTNWTSGNNLTSARYNGFGSGTQTAAMFSGGIPPSPTDIVANVEQYDGTNWTAFPASLTGGQAAYASQNVGTSSRDSTLIAGGAFGPGGGSHTGVTQIFNGTTWRTAPSMSTARKGSLTGDSSAALEIGGQLAPGSNTSATEEFSGAKSIQTLTQS